jgi:glycoprotein-N-acetylgalactosamine 3-beta-galactosyltransferase
MYLPPECDVLGSSDAVLLNKVIVAKEHTNAFRISPAGKKPAIRLFCGIYTTAKRHESHIRIIRDTWGRKCTGFLAFSTATDAALPAVALPHLGEESYDNMWQKVRSIWRYIRHHYAQEYDYFLLGGDDMLYIPENLYKYLAVLPFRVWKDQQNGVYLGRRFTTTDGAENVTFNSGGAGYILDQRAVEILAENLDEPHCKPTDIDLPFEDVNVAQCLASARNALVAAAKLGGSGEPGSGDAQEAVNADGETSLESAGESAPSPVLPADTRDEFQLQQFHPLPPGTHWLYRPQNPSPTLQQDWFYNYDPDMQFGFNCCSTNSISFHYVDPALMRAMYDYLYVCDPALKRAYFAHYGEHYFETTYSVQFLHA